MRTLVIGDVHGAYRALLQCLERSNFDYEHDQLISLGDIADGWSEVPECVEELLKIKNLIAIKGNHDDWAYQWMQFRVKNENWLNQGGQATYDAYTVYHPDLIEKHQHEFFGKQHYYYIDDKNRAFIHGGFTHRDGVGHEEHSGTYMWDRLLWRGSVTYHNIRERTIRNGKTPNNPPIQLRQHEEIYVGHTSVTEFMTTSPMRAHNMWNLDTGAGWNGKLSIMDIDTRTIWQSDNVTELYPEEFRKREKERVKMKIRAKYKRRHL